MILKGEEIPIVCYIYGIEAVIDPASVVIEKKIGMCTGIFLKKILFQTG